MAELDVFGMQRELVDVWNDLVPFGRISDSLHSLSDYPWNFPNLPDAFEEDGVLHQKKVYLFCCSEMQFLPVIGQCKVISIPVMVAIVCPFPPSDKVVINFEQRELSEQIVHMKKMKLDWVPYIPVGYRGGSSAERLESQIFMLSGDDRSKILGHLKSKGVKNCIPYFYHPCKEDETEQSTFVRIKYPIDCEFDWEIGELEEFTDELIAAKKLSEDQKSDFMEVVREKVKEGKRANLEAKRLREGLSPNEVALFENMRFYKFYPVATLDTLHVPIVKYPFINRYYGNAHQVL